MTEQFEAGDAHEHSDATVTEKICSQCGGAVHGGITRRQRDDGTFVSYAEGVCQSCGRQFDEAELLTLEGPGPVGG
jgi:hypothetical protein